MLTKYITPSDFKNYFGIDLELSLPHSDMKDGRNAERFIMQVEDDVALFLETKCFKRVDYLYSKLSEYQKECYKKALLNQAKYKFENGDIGNDSGYNPDTGVVAGRSELRDIELSSKTIDYLTMAGLYNRSITGAMYGGGFPFIR